MNTPNPSPIPLAVRIYPVPQVERARPMNNPSPRLPEAMLVFDTETTIDPTQRLLFGSYRFIVNYECQEEGIFYADDLTADEMAILEAYVASNSAENAGRLKLVSREAFLKKLFTAAYKGRALIVGFNLPFDLSRLGSDVSEAKAEFKGGFSLGLWSYRNDKDGIQR